MSPSRFTWRDVVENQTLLEQASLHGDEWATCWLIIANDIDRQRVLRSKWFKCYPAGGVLDCSRYSELRHLPVYPRLPDSYRRKSTSWRDSTLDAYAQTWEKRQEELLRRASSTSYARFDYGWRSDSNNPFLRASGLVGTAQDRDDDWLTDYCYSERIGLLEDCLRKGFSGAVGELAYRTRPTRKAHALAREAVDAGFDEHLLWRADVSASTGAARKEVEFYFRRAAEAGSIEALEHLDIEEAAAKGSPWAMLRIGCWHADRAIDLKLFVDEVKTAKDRNSYYYSARTDIPRYELEIEEHYRPAIELLTRAADAGNPWALLALGELAGQFGSRVEATRLKYNFNRLTYSSRAAQSQAFVRRLNS